MKPFLAQVLFLKEGVFREKEKVFTINIIYASGS